MTGPARQTYPARPTPNPAPLKDLSDPEPLKDLSDDLADKTSKPKGLTELPRNKAP